MGDILKCRRCGAALQIAKMPTRTSVRLICYGCRIKKRSRVTEAGCWIWQGAKRGNYGIMRVLFQGRYRIRNVHRVAYALWREPVEHSWAVLHTNNCRTHLCCNPEHLRVIKQLLRRRRGLWDRAGREADILLAYQSSPMFRMYIKSQILYIQKGILWV